MIWKLTLKWLAELNFFGINGGISKRIFKEHLKKQESTYSAILSDFPRP